MMGRAARLGEIGGNVRGALATISKNEEFIHTTLALLMTPEWPVSISATEEQRTFNM